VDDMFLKVRKLDYFQEVESSSKGTKSLRFSFLSFAIFMALCENFRPALYQTLFQPVISKNDGVLTCFVNPQNN